jgi:hypothetical protein
VRDAVFGEFLLDSRRQADGDGHGEPYDNIVAIVLRQRRWAQVRLSADLLHFCQFEIMITA